MYKSGNNLYTNNAIWQWIWRNNGEPKSNPPSPSSTQILTESGDTFITESGDLIFTEGV